MNNIISTGVLVIEELYYVYKTRRNETAVVLWRGEDSLYSHPSGEMKEVDGNDMRKTAERVLAESSSGLIYFLNSELFDFHKGALVQLNPNLTYVIGIKSGILFRKDFHDNQARFKNFTAVPVPWKKSVAMDRFYISDLISTIEKKEIDSFVEGESDSFTSCYNANDEICHIQNKTLDIIKHALNNGAISLVTQFPFNYIRISHESNGFKCGLISLIPSRSSNIQKNNTSISSSRSDQLKNHFNVEIKAQIPSEKINEIRRNIKKYASSSSPKILKQHDTFYNCIEKSGRLKLRREKNQNELISYQREDNKGPKKSDISRCTIKNSASLDSVLTHSLGAIGDVRKTRELYWIGSARIHIDSVENLDGCFIEFEVTKCNTTEEGQDEIKRLLSKLEISEEWLIDRSYMDLIIESLTL